MARAHYLLDLIQNEVKGARCANRNAVEMKKIGAHSIAEPFRQLRDEFLQTARNMKAHWQELNADEDCGENRLHLMECGM